VKILQKEKVQSQETHPGLKKILAEVDEIEYQRLSRISLQLQGEHFLKLRLLQQISQE